MREFIFWTTGVLGIVALVLGWWLSPWWELLMLAPAALWLWASVVPSCDWWGPQMKEFPTRKREALLTFDHAPHPLETPVVLDLLEAEGAKGLFFLTGVQAMRHPEVVKLIVSRCTELDSGGRMVDAILTNTVLPAISQEFLNRMVEGQPVSRVQIKVIDGEFGFEFD